MQTNYHHSSVTYLPKRKQIRKVLNRLNVHVKKAKVLVDGISRGSHSESSHYFSSQITKIRTQFERCRGFSARERRWQVMSGSKAKLKPSRYVSRCCSVKTPTIFRTSSRELLAHDV